MLLVCYNVLEQTRPQLALSFILNTIKSIANIPAFSTTIYLIIPHLMGLGNSNIILLLALQENSVTKVVFSVLNKIVVS